jgi:hypothetical protein
MFPVNHSSVHDALNHVTGTAQSSTGITVQTFLASLTTGSIIFMIEITLFIFVKNRLPDI